VVRIDTSSSLVCTLIISVSYWCWIAFEVWLVARERGTSARNAQDRGSRNSIIIWWCAGIVLGIFAAPYLMPSLMLPGNAVVLFVVGMMLVWAGILLRFWAVQTLGKFFRSKVEIQAEHRLIRSGPYRYLRNPSYTGVLITLVGFGVGVGNWLSVCVLLAAGLLSFVRRIAVEDSALADRFGKEYADYRKGTWALVPFLW